MRTADGYIVNRCLNGDSAAFGLLVDKYRTGVYALAYSRLRDFQDAEDVAQEVFIKAYRKLRTLKQFDSFHAWLYAITANLCKDWLRARSRRPDREYIEDQDPEILEAPSMDAYREELVSEMIHEALDSLPETYQQVLTLYYLGGMNSREIAEFLGTSPAAIRERLSRARSQLKEGRLTMMSTTFEAKRLPASFTFRIVEAIKHVKIQPLPRMSGLPWGLSFATGIIITVLSLSPHLSILNPASLPTGSPLPVEAKSLKVGEIPVDVLEISHISVISSKQENGDGGESIFPAPQKALLLAPHGEGGTWTQKADMPTARWGFGTSVVGGKIYAIGGVVRMGWNLTPAVECYDPVDDTWTIKASIPTLRAELSTCVVDGKIYAIGGTKNSNSSLKTVEVYDPATDTWEKKADMPTARSAFSTSVVDGIIYAIGGKIGWNIPALSTVEAYDPEADAWTKKENMPTARCYLSTTAVDGIVYAIGGSPWDADWAACSTVEAYDPVANTWTKKADMIEARGSLSTVVVDGKIYAVGGSGDGNPQGIQVIEIYDPMKDTWTEGKADMPTGRHTLSASAVDGKIYAIGGITGAGNQVFATVEEFTPEGLLQPGLVSPQSKLPTKWGAEKGRGDRRSKQ